MDDLTAVVLAKFLQTQRCLSSAVTVELVTWYVGLLRHQPWSVSYKDTSRNAAAHVISRLHA